MNEEDSFCENCGKPLKAGSDFCPYCGAPVNRSTPQENEPVLPNNGTPAPYPPAPKKSNTWIWILVAAAAAAALLVVGFFVIGPRLSHLLPSSSSAVASSAVSSGTLSADSSKASSAASDLFSSSSGTSSAASASSAPAVSSAAPTSAPAAVTPAPSVSSVSSAASGTSETPMYDTTMIVVNCKEWITLRESPSTSSASLRQIPLGDSVTFLGNAENGFYHVSYLGTEGYALASYLTLAGSSAAQNPAPAAQILHVINCNEYITLRATPSTSGTDLAHIPLGAAVTFVANSSNGFYEVSYNGQDGYALASYLGS
jgi:uncharacterized protein YgiM (DUF1202 family)